MLHVHHAGSTSADRTIVRSRWKVSASGAALVSYWHWHSLHYGQETYWKGLLGHDLEPNRVYGEMSRVGQELKRLGPIL